VCQSCLNTSFCPLGSTADISYSALDVIIQAVAYPTSPELTVFDDILLENMFTIGSTKHCLLVSPAFWALMSMIISFVILISILILQFFPRMHKLHYGLKGFFKRTDLVRDGELWTGGLASLSILVFIGFAAYFSASFVQQYPVENVGDSYFACDLTIRNAKFFTAVQSLGTPPTTEEQPIFDMMNSQSFIFNIDFVQTAFNCTAVSVYNTRLTIPTSVPFTCATQSISNIISISVNLTSVNNNLQINLSGILPIGALRIGMAAPEQMENEYLVRQLNFLQPFYANNCILAPQSTFSLELTKVINITEPLDNAGTTQYSALFIPTFLVNLDQTFISQTDYNSMSSYTQTSISIAISETSYYINNNQSPIAKQTEIIFQNILFALVCIEIFGFGFLICKLFFLPVIEYCLRKYHGGNKHGTTNDEERRRSSD
jgi:fumarate reductase subunit D